MLRSGGRASGQPAPPRCRAAWEADARVLALPRGNARPAGRLKNKSRKKYRGRVVVGAAPATSAASSRARTASTAPSARWAAGLCAKITPWADGDAGRPRASRATSRRICQRRPPPESAIWAPCSRRTSPCRGRRRPERPRGGHEPRDDVNARRRRTGRRTPSAGRPGRVLGVRAAWSTCHRLPAPAPPQSTYLRSRCRSARRRPRLRGAPARRDGLPRRWAPPPGRRCTSVLRHAVVDDHQGLRILVLMHVKP